MIHIYFLFKIHVFWSYCYPLPNSAKILTVLPTQLHGFSLSLSLLKQFMKIKTENKFLSVCLTLLHACAESLKCGWHPWEKTGSPTSRHPLPTAVWLELGPPTTTFPFSVLGFLSGLNWWRPGVCCHGGYICILKVFPLSGFLLINLGKLKLSLVLFCLCLLGSGIIGICHYNPLKIHKIL